MVIDSVCNRRKLMVSVRKSMVMVFGRKEVDSVEFLGKMCSVRKLLKLNYDLDIKWEQLEVNEFV